MKVVILMRISQSLQVLLDLLALVLNRASKIGKHFLIKTDYSVTVHLVLDLPALFGTHLERAICLLGQVALAESLLLRRSCVCH